MGKPQIGGNKSCKEHMEGKMRDVKRGESTWKQMKIPQSLQWRQHDISLIWRFNGEPEAARGRCIESTAESGREWETKTVIECRRETGQEPNRKTEITRRHLQIPSVAKISWCECKGMIPEVSIPSFLCLWPALPQPEAVSAITRCYYLSGYNGFECWLDSDWIHSEENKEFTDNDAHFLKRTEILKLLLSVPRY